MTKKKVYIVSKTFDRFISQVYPEPNTGCWLWGGGTKRGYAIFEGNGLRSGHRYSYFYYHGEFDRKMCVLHKCDNPSCVNPDHLYLGDQKQNNIDRDIRGRHKPLRGATNGRAKLNDQQVIEIRALHDPKAYPTRKLGRMFGVSQRKIFDIIHRNCWKHV